MEKKYYDLIISKIKNNKKYSGLEAILEDIANHVFEQASSVISTISNEDVVENYIEKLVNTAMVTVPRKLNFKKNLDKKSSLETILANQESPKHINENILSTEEPKDIVIENTTNIDTTDAEPATHKVDIELVEKMINGTHNEKEEHGNNEETAFIDDEALELYESLENFQDDSDENNEESIEEIELDNNLEEFEVVEDLNDEIQESESDNEETVLEENFIEIDSEEIVEELTEEVKLDNDLEEFEVVEELNDKIQESEINNDESELEENFVEIDSEEIVEELTEEVKLDNDLKEFEVVEEQIQAAEDKMGTTNNDFYKLFSYTPSQTEDITDEVKNIIKDLDKKFPNKNILTICYLKYNHKLSINEISEKTGFEIDFIIEALNEIVNAVKD